METPHQQRQVERSVNTSLTEYLHSGRWQALQGIDQEAAASFLKSFLDASHRQFGVKPEQLQPEQLREILLSILPKRIAAKRKGAAHAVEVVHDYFEYLTDADSGKKLKWPTGFKKQFTDAKKLFPKALAGETNVGGVEKAEPLRNPEKPVGRNDPCPCGSGKKFKKCCMASPAT